MERWLVSSTDESIDRASRLVLGDVGFVIVIGAVLAALGKLVVLQNIETIWIVLGVAALIGLGIMISVANSGVKENIQVDRK